MDYNFKLKVIEKKEGFFPNRLHYHGGTDVLQIWAFQHLFPDCWCPWTHRDLLFSLAEMHNWKIEVTEEKEKI